MKKILAIVLALVMVLGLAACGGKEEKIENPNLIKIGDHQALYKGAWITTDYDGEVVKWSFTRTEDADDRLVGCWDAATVDASGGRVERHYKFATPTYGDVYEMVYDQRGVCTDTRFLYDFRYTISGDRIQFKMLVGGTDGVIFNKYFRLEGTKLYLRDKVNGEEVMYSNFYEENGLPFHP